MAKKRGKDPGPNKVPIYVLRHVPSGLYYKDAGVWIGPPGNQKWVPRADQEDPDGACEMDDAEIAIDFPDGLPPNWEKVHRYDLEVKPKK